MALSEKLKEFCSIFGRDDFNIGEISFVQTDSSQIFTENLELKGQIAEFYNSVKFNKLSISGALMMEIFSLEKLPKAQEGWRWIFSPSGEKIEDTQNWNKNQLVFADRNGDAIFTFIDNPLSPVWGTIQKSRNFQLAGSLENFFEIINQCLIIEKEKFDLETQTEDFEIKPEFMKMVAEVLDKIEPQNKNSFMDFFFD